MASQIKKKTRNKWNIMEICGGQTHSIVKHRIEELLPPQIQLLHGPGCPVCVTSEKGIDEAIRLSFINSTILVTFADMLRVPGTKESLAQARARGAQVETVYSPLDAVDIALKNPESKIVFFAIGFETTALPNAIALLKAKQQELSNFFLLVSQVLVPPAIESLLNAQDCQINAFLAAGHVCTVMGSIEYEALVKRHLVPIVITGFEPVDVLMGILMCIEQLEQGQALLEIQYSRLVERSGNTRAQDILKQVFEVCDIEWRGMGTIPQSGWKLSPEYLKYDARVEFADELLKANLSDLEYSQDCRSGLVLQGRMKPIACPHFMKKCHPLNPLGAPMVSSEGACAAYAQYKENYESRM
jgi:hydrogenase expression/formation protein HypD